MPDRGGLAVAAASEAVHMLRIYAYAAHICISRSDQLANAASLCSGRNNALTGGPRCCSQLLTDLAGKFKTRPFSYFWAEGAQQPALEASVGVGG